MNIDSVFRGIMATPITSFDAQGNLYPKGIENLVMFMKKGGIDCLYCLGTYGGFALMSKKERMEAAEIFISICKQQDIKLIVNISSPFTREAVELAHHAAQHGADAISSLVPYYYSEPTLDWSFSMQD